MSTHGIKRKRQKVKTEMGFELNPARCLNCDHFKPPLHGVAGKVGTWRQAACGIGLFPVLPSSICDKWAGRDGEILETS